MHFSTNQVEHKNSVSLNIDTVIDIYAFDQRDKKNKSNF